jgi:hypothetical protein
MWSAVARLGLSFKNVWPAPSARGFRELIWPVCVNVSGLGAACPGQDGDPRDLVLIRHAALMRHFLYQVSRTLVDCQAISLFTTSRHQWPCSTPAAVSADLCYVAAGTVAAPNSSPRRKTAHAIRASLLARATTATFLCARFISARSQCPRGVGPLASIGNADRAPWMINLRKYLLPRLVMPTNRGLPQVVT